MSDEAVYIKVFSSAKNVQNKKSGLRKLLLSERKKLSPDVRRDKSANIADNLFSLEIFKSSTKIAIYHPINAEVDTKYIFLKSIAEGKRVYYPKVVDSSLNFFYIEKLEALEAGFKGILEPRDFGEELSKDKLDLILVPGLGFDYSGNRLGYGGGFYDRYLKELSGIKSAALAFDFQVMHYLPVSNNDIKVGQIVTESRVIDCMDYKGGIKCKP